VIRSAKKRHRGQTLFVGDSDDDDTVVGVPLGAVIQACRRHLRFHMHFTPTGSSWINQVERWFGFLTEQKIRRGAHKSVQTLEADIRAWIADWNSHPRPFIWTKTAEEILESLARFCRRIPGAGGDTSRALAGH